MIRSHVSLPTKPMDIKNVYKRSVRKLEEKRPLTRLRRGWEDNIKVAVMGKRSRVCGLNLYGLGWRLVVGSCEHGNETSIPKKCINS
jgi:hypothetical protein